MKKFLIKRLRERLILGKNVSFLIPLIFFLLTDFLFTYVIWTNFNSTFINFFSHISTSYLQTTIIVLISLILVFSILSPLKILRIQFRRNRPSWAWYALWAVLTTPIFMAFSIESTYELKFLMILFSLFSLLVYLFIGEETDKQKRFAYDAIGTGGDELNFSPHVDGFIKSLDSLKDCVCVVSLFGDLGHGKSSFLRMVVEKMNQDSFLYTYISLTETNEAKDFSQLFAERWRETLVERYPSIDTTSAINMLKPILREINRDFISTLFDFIDRFNRQISETKIVFSHSLNKNEDDHLDKETAKLFGYVNSFSETRWFIVIDELERSKREEIFRSIEIIERFKTLGLKGLPIQIIFIICTSEKDLKELLDQNPSEPSKQIGDFFFNNPKTFSNYEFIPYPSWEKMISFIQANLSNIRNDKKFRNLFDRYEKDSRNLRFPQRTITNLTIDSDKLSSEDVIDVITLLLARESPRLAKKVVGDLIFVTQRLSVTSMMTDQMLPFPFSHMLLMSYIRIKFPELFVFLHETADDVFRTTEDKIYDNMLKSILDKKEISTFQEWFEDVRGKKAHDYDWDLFEKLVSLASYEYLDYLRKKRKDYLEDYIKFKFLPYGLLRYLRAVKGLQLPEDADFVLFLRKYEKGVSFGEIVKNSEELYLFANNSRRIYSLKPTFHLKISEEIIERINTGKIVVEKRKLREGIYAKLIYEFLLHLNEAFRKTSGKNKKARTLAVTKIGELLNKFFNSDKVTLGGKFTVLNSLIREERSSEVLWKLDDLLKMLEDEKLFTIKNGVMLTLNHFRKKYVENKEIIYDNEDNFFYVLYQYWSGNKDDENGIKTIQSIVLRDLEKYPDVVEIFWDMLPYDQDSDVEDLFTDDFLWFMHSKLHPYITVNDLIKITKKVKLEDGELKNKFAYWKKQGKKAEKAYIQAYPLKDENTLMKVLINRGLSN